MTENAKLQEAIRDFVDSEYFNKKVINYTHKTCEEVFKKQEELVIGHVSKTLKSFGVDVDHPLELQKDFADMRNSRLGKAEVSKWTKRILIGFGISAFITFVLSGINEAIHDIAHNINISEKK